jgi:hypothetical protein
LPVDVTALGIDDACADEAAVIRPADVARMTKDEIMTRRVAVTDMLCSLAVV